MKNIHIIPTNKLNRLKQNKITKKLSLVNKGIDLTAYIPVNIYITSDEEINQQTKPCWCINTIKNTWNADLIYYQGSMLQYHYVGFKKIILATDPDLIKNGVQAINDEFLEWFVKNPSCEWIDVKYQYLKEINNIGKYTYKIIIPKEEQCTCENPTDNNCNYCNELEIKQILSKAELNTKQETLEETAEKYVDNFEYSIAHPKRACKNAFINGAKWQQKRSYSEEEVYNILEMAMISGYTEELEIHYSGDFKNLKKWFKQFKKK